MWPLVRMPMTSYMKFAWAPTSDCKATTNEHHDAHGVIYLTELSRGQYVHTRHSVTQINLALSLTNFDNDVPKRSNRSPAEYNRGLGVASLRQLLGERLFLGIGGSAKSVKRLLMMTSLCNLEVKPETNHCLARYSTDEPIEPYVTLASVETVHELVVYSKFLSND